EVRLSWTATKVNTSCQCPAFADYGPCKHIVAAIYQLIELQSDQNGGIEEAATISKTKAKSAADPVLFEKLVVIGNAANLFRDVDWRIGYHGAAKGELRKMAASNLDEDNCVWD